MSQSNVIFGVLLFAFIIYITSRGQLPEYISLFTTKGSSAASGSKSTTQTPASKSKGVNWVSSFLGYVKNIKVE